MSETLTPGAATPEPVPAGAALAPQASARAPGLPPLYSKLEGVTAARHAALRVRDAGFGFAAKATAVPLAAEEFVLAARSLPIVFAPQAPHLPVAITGLAAGSNLFVEANGAWRAGAYLPAYLRRYPFFMLRVAAGSEELALCIDPDASHVSDTQGEPLFTAEGKPAPQLDRSFALAKAVEEAVMKTRIMTARLAELGLLKGAVIQFMHNGKPMRVDGFFTVDREALRALPPERLAELRDLGWLEAIYAHLMSIGGIQDLARG